MTWCGIDPIAWHPLRLELFRTGYVLRGHLASSCCWPFSNKGVAPARNHPAHLKGRDQRDMHARPSANLSPQPVTRCRVDVMPTPRAEPNLPAIELPTCA